MASDIAQIKSAAERIPDHAVREYCLIIIDTINDFSQKSKETNPFWTYRTFSKWVRSDIQDERLLQSLSFLSSSIAPLLRKRYLWLSPEEEDEGLREVDDEFVRNALANNVAEDPSTGELVRDPRKHLVPYFTPLIRSEAPRG